MQHSTPDFAIQWNIQCEMTVRRLLDYMDRGTLIWQYASDGIDCYYAASYQGKTLKLSCCHKEKKYLLIDGKALDIDSERLKVLCDKVAVQQRMRHIQEHLKEFDIFTNEAC